MADKNTGVGRERIGSRSDEQVTGRESTARTDRIGEYGSPGGTPPISTSSSATGNTSVHEPSPEVRTRQIRAEIEETRGHMSETVNEIQDRLRPGTIAANAAENIREVASERVRDIANSESVHYVRANPIPTAMVGIGIAGLAWLVMGGRDADESRGNRYRGTSSDWRRAPRGYDVETGYRGTSAAGDYDSSAYDFESPAGRSAYAGTESYGTETTSNISERTGEMARDLRHRAEDTTRRVRQSASRAQSTLQRTLNESPLLIGAAAAVVGALIGSAVPETQRENQLMGETRDNMIEGVEQAVKEKVEKVQNAATDAVSQVQKAAGLTDENTPGPDQKATAGPKGTTGQSRQSS